MCFQNDMAYGDFTGLARGTAFVNVLCDRAFKNAKFKFQLYVCNGYHDLMQKAMSPHDAAIAFVKKNNYRINFGDMSKDKAKNLLRNVVLTEKSWSL